MGQSGISIMAEEPQVQLSHSFSKEHKSFVIQHTKSISNL